MDSKVLHVPMSDAEHRRLKAIAAEKGTTIGIIAAAALATHPSTRKAFQTKETSK